MNRFILIAYVVLILLMALVSFPDGSITALLIVFLTIPTIFLINQYSRDKNFLLNVFIIGLIARIMLGLAIYFLDLREVFGPDSYHYDAAGTRLAEIWMGFPVPNDTLTFRVTNRGSGWGMYYIFGSLYFLFGKNFVMAQAFCGFIGAATIPMVYVCADNIFNNRRVSKISAIFVALFPSFIIWSSQLLKDGLIIFLIVATMVLVFQLQKKLSYLGILLLIMALFGILALRFYIFYMVVLSVAGSFVVGLGTSVTAIGRNIVAIILIGLTLTYLGVIRNAQQDIDTYTNLETIQTSRLDLAQSADSGFAEDIDVSTPAGALTAIPVGFLYLMFAPFPWQVQKANQILLLPEMFIWWALFPLIISGIWYALKVRLKQSIPILTFTAMLTIAYSIFQGNVGMAYRQRTQIQVFLFVFIAVGWSLIQERSENKIIKRQLREEKLRRKLKARRLEMDS